MSSILRAGLIIAYPYAQLSLRIFLKSLREAGGVNQLALDLQSILKSSDQNETNSSDIKLEGYKYVYSLLGNATRDEDEDITRASALTLITLAKYSSIFGSKIESNDMKEFFKNDDAIFVGALLLKICRVAVLNNSISFLKNLDCTSSPEQKLNGQCRAQCCGNHAFIAPKISSIAISCTPNVGRCATSDNTVIIFALKPIEKGEQLVNSIYSIYKPAPLPVRQRVYKKRYGSACCCQTCAKNWTEESLTQNVPKESATQVDRMMDEMISITKRVGPKDDNDVELLHKTKECLEVFWKHLKLPSLYLVCAVKYLTHFFTSVYGERSTIPDSCKP
ncbi:hypothetical protein QAD02_018679 [Eretmocerus hayati]|uniref:Uncharacterized protein n=1 Tax=Eretmocerus hayati TaxID=131215 RepID=A0ACC2PKF8_9HYME|nr:hypothetical protein QAD02_018679 [Eretmocerus hayati]